MKLPETNWVNAYGVAAFDYDNDGWVDLVAVGETKDGKGEVRLFRNLGPDGFKDVTADVGLDKIQLKDPRAIITGDYDNDGATDLLITQNHGPAVLLRNEGGNQESTGCGSRSRDSTTTSRAIGTKVEVFSGGNRQKFEIYGSSGYLGQNSTRHRCRLGQAKQADIVRMLWPTGVLQDEIEVAGDKGQRLPRNRPPRQFLPDSVRVGWRALRIRCRHAWRGSGRTLGWARRSATFRARSEYIKLNRNAVREKDSVHFVHFANGVCHPERSEGPVYSPASCTDPSSLKAVTQDDKARGSGRGKTLSFRFMEPLEEAVYLDQVRLMAVDHPADTEVYPNEYFASNPPYPSFKVVLSHDARPPAGAWDEHGHDVLPALQAHRYFGDFTLTQFAGFAKPHTLTLDLGEALSRRPAMAADARRSRVLHCEQHVCRIASRRGSDLAVCGSPRRKRPVEARHQ